MLKTVTVQGTLYNPDGSPAAGAIGKARLTHYETDGGIVVPSVVSLITDEAGRFSLQLWPNERGQAGSKYEITAYSGRTLLLNVYAVVPDVDVPVYLASIINQAPYPPVDAAELAVQQAQAAASEAIDARDVASEKADSFTSQLAQMGEQIIALQAVVAEHYGFGE